MKYLFYIATLVLAGYTITSCNNGKRPVENIVVDTTSTIQNNGVKIAYTDTGKGDTTLLFIHGWAINRGYWADQVTYFGKRYRVVAIDLPGFGQSGKNRSKWDTRAFSSDVDSVIKELNLKNVILIGHSMSGDIALQAATESSEEVIGLVGVDNFKSVGEKISPETVKQYAAAVAEMKQNFKKIAFEYIKHDLFSQTTPIAVKNWVLNDASQADTVIAVASMAQQDLGFDEIAKLKQYGKKLYLINSDVTPTNTTVMARDSIPFQVYYTKGTGHYAMIENPREFNALLEEVIKDIQKERH